MVLASPGYGRTLSFRRRPDGSVSVLLSLTPVAVVLTAMALAAIFLLPAKVLAVLGIPYGSTGGNPLTKIHPASYIGVVSLVAWALAVGGPGRLIGDIWRRQPGFLAFTAAVLLLTFQVVFVQKAPISFVIDTFILAIAVHVGLAKLDDRTVIRFATAVHIFFALNSLIGYGEGLTGLRLTPLYIGDKLVTYDWRSTAFFGHPLSAAGSTGLYIVLLAAGAGPFRGGQRVALMLFHLGAMTYFGGRTALVAALVAIAVLGLISGVRLLAGQTFSARRAAAAVFASAVVAVGLVLLIDAGAFDRFIDRFTNDSGSAATRLAMLSMFQNFDLQGLLIAPDLGIVADSQRRLDLSLGIESTFVAFVAYFGLFVSVCFFAGLAAFIAEVVRAVGPRATGPLLYFFVQIAGTTGIASKSPELVTSTSLIVLLLSPALNRNSALARRPRVAEPKSC